MGDRPFWIILPLAGAVTIGYLSRPYLGDSWSLILVALFSFALGYLEKGR